MSSYSHDAKTRRTLRFSLFDGIFAAAAVGFTQDYFTPFLLLVGGTAWQVGMLAAFPNLFSSFIQLKSAEVTERVRSRRRIVTGFVFLQACMLLPIVWIVLAGKMTPIFFIALVVLFSGLGTFVVPPWASWMSDLVDGKKRGAYFGWRNSVVGFVLVGTTLMAGFILQGMRRVNPLWGFVILFSGAFVFRMMCGYFLFRMHEPHLAHNPEDRFSIFKMLGQARESNFSRFVIFVALMYFGVNIASPFFSVLMLRDLSFNYALYTCITVTATITMYLVMGRWGRLADSIGNIKVIKFTSCIIAILPLLWLISRHPIFLFFAQIISGFAWAGFNLCTSNFIYDAVTPAKRVRCIAYFNALIGFSASLGALLGGFLIEHLPKLFGNSILMLFVVAVIVRLGVACVLSRGLAEVRPAEKISNRKLFFRMLGARATVE